MSVIKFNSADEFITALEARRDHWQAIDDERLAEHRKREQEYLEQLHEACRTVLTWDYDTAKVNYFRLPRTSDGSSFSSHSAPTCPVSEVARLDRAISNLRKTSQRRFNITPDSRGVWGVEYYLLSADPRESDSLC